MPKEPCPISTARHSMRRRHQDAVADFFFKSNLNPLQHEPREAATKRFELLIAQANHATDGAISRNLHAMPDVANEYFKNKSWLALAFMREGFNPGGFSLGREHQCYIAVPFSAPECLEIIQRGIAAGWEPGLDCARPFSHPTTPYLAHWIRSALPIETGFPIFEALFDASPNYSFEDAAYCASAFKLSAEQRQRAQDILHFAAARFEARDLGQALCDSTPILPKANSKATRL